MKLKGWIKECFNPEVEKPLSQEEVYKRDKYFRSLMAKTQKMTPQQLKEEAETLYKKQKEQRKGAGTS